MFILFITQRHHWIHVGASNGWDQYGDQAYAPEQCDDRSVNRRLSGRGGKNAVVCELAEVSTAA